jgi:hypothetical protein
MIGASDSASRSRLEAPVVFCCSQQGYRRHALSANRGTTFTTVMPTEVGTQSGFYKTSVDR